MGSSKYLDTVAIVQVIGSVFIKPQLLDETDKYVITEEDFVSDFHKIVFGAIYKVYELGAEKISIESICDFLASKPKSEAIFTTNKGEEWLKAISEKAIPTAFDFYYNRMKKMTLLRAYDNYGIDVKFIYDPDTIDTKKLQLQEEQLDSMSLTQIADKVDAIIDGIRLDYVSDSFGDTHHAAEGIDALIDRLMTYPEVGVPLYGRFINRITRGARLKKFYLRSAPTGVGKSRSMIADCCYIGTNMIYDDMLGWIGNGVAEPCLYISTEQELEEIQTMMLAFLSSVNEEHIINNQYQEGELERVRRAAEVLKASPIYIEELPDFSLQDVEDTIKKGIREHNVKYVFHDYIHTSMKILEEVTRRSGGVKLREDNVLFMLSIRLKDICNRYGIFIESATQLNADYQESETPDQNLLRCAKAIADKIDYGSILLPVSQKDLDSLENLLKQNIFERPNLKLSIYKNRRGQYKGIYLWCKSNLGTCRVEPMFATDWRYQLIEMDDFEIKVEPGAFND
jgi:replicative DNA helicase